MPVANAVSASTTRPRNARVDSRFVGKVPASMVRKSSRVRMNTRLPTTPATLPSRSAITPLSWEMSIEWSILSIWAWSTPTLFNQVIPSSTRALNWSEYVGSRVANLAVATTSDTARPIRMP